MTLERYTKYVNASTIAIILLAILSLVAVHAIRLYTQDSIMPGERSYYHTRLADRFLQDNKPLFYDDLSYSGRIMSLQQATPILLASFSRLTTISTQSSCTVLPIIFSIITMLSFYFIIIKLLENRKLAQLSLLFLALSPPFIYTFSTCNQHFMPISFILLGVVALLYKKRTLAFISFLLVPFFSTIYAAIAMSLFLINVLVRKENKKLFFLTLLLNIAAIVLLNLLTIKYYGMPELLNFKIQEIGINFTFQGFIAEFGSKFGISIFAIMLAFSGLVAMWKKKYKFINVYIAIILFTLLSIYLIWPIIHLNFLVAMLAAVGIFYLMSIKWESKLIKNMTIFIMLAGMIFTFLLQINTMANIMPNQDILDSLQALNAESNPNDIILSHYSNGFWIESIAARPAFMDANFVYAPNVNARYNDANTIFYSRSIDEVTSLLDKHKIKYIWITKDMKSGQVWQDDNQDLLFLLKYNTNFKRLFSNQNTELYWYKGEQP